MRRQNSGDVAAPDSEGVLLDTWSNALLNNVSQFVSAVKAHAQTVENGEAIEAIRSQVYDRPQTIMKWLIQALHGLTSPDTVVSLWVSAVEESLTKSRLTEHGLH